MQIPREEQAEKAVIAAMVVVAEAVPGEAVLMYRRQPTLRFKPGSRLMVGSAATEEIIQIPMVRPEVAAAAVSGRIFLVPGQAS
jgi:hypothetical protein